MSHFIIYRKLITLEKKKEFVFRFPALINPINVEFQIECPSITSMQNTRVVFNLKSIKGNKLIQLPVEIDNFYTQQKLSNMYQLLSEEYLLISCISDEKQSILLSIKIDLVK